MQALGNVVAPLPTNSAQPVPKLRRPAGCPGCLPCCQWLPGSLAGWLLAGWLAGCMAGWLAGWLPAWLDGWLAGWLDGWLAGWLAAR